MGDGWDESAPGVVSLPSGRVVRGRSLRAALAPGPVPDFAVDLAGSAPPPATWEARWLVWPDFWLPKDPAAAYDTLLEAWRRSADERVEVACRGGRGRTGTALACIAVLDGVPAQQAVSFIRTHLHPRAVETPWQRRYVLSFRPV